MRTSLCICGGNVAPEVWEDIMTGFVMTFHAKVGNHEAVFGLGDIFSED
jgi:hypothetical protein